MVDAEGKMVEISWALYLDLIDQTALAIQAEAKALRQFTREIELELLMDKHLASAETREISPLLAILLICSTEGHQQFVSLN